MKVMHTGFLADDQSGSNWFTTRTSRSSWLPLTTNSHIHEYVNEYVHAVATQSLLSLETIIKGWRRHHRANSNINAGTHQQLEEDWRRFNQVWSSDHGLEWICHHTHSTLLTTFVLNPKNAVLWKYIDMISWGFRDFWHVQPYWGILTSERWACSYRW